MAKMAGVNTEFQQIDDQLAEVKKLIEDRHVFLAQNDIETAQNQASLDNLKMSAKDQMRSILGDVLVSRDNLLKANATVRSPEEINPLEKEIGSLHLKNLLYLRAKVLKHSRLPRMVEESVTKGEVGYLEKVKSCSFAAYPDFAFCVLLICCSAGFGEA